MSVEVIKYVFFSLHAEVCVLKSAHVPIRHNLFINAPVTAVSRSHAKAPFIKHKEQRRRIWSKRKRVGAA